MTTPEMEEIAQASAAHFFQHGSMHGSQMRNHTTGQAYSQSHQPQHSTRKTLSVCIHGTCTHRYLVTDDFDALPRRTCAERRLGSRDGTRVRPARLNYLRGGGTA